MFTHTLVTSHGLKFLYLMSFLSTWIPVAITAWLFASSVPYACIAWSAFPHLPHPHLRVFSRPRWMPSSCKVIYRVSASGVRIVPCIGCMCWENPTGSWQWQWEHLALGTIGGKWLEDTGYKDWWRWHHATRIITLITNAHLKKGWVYHCHWLWLGKYSHPFLPFATSSLRKECWPHKPLGGD